jgi:LmbE family N-acetylglucosaminyl deacetylase
LSTVIRLSDPMKPTQTSSKVLPLLAFGAHPDDVEFGCGGVVLNETPAGREAHLVVCSRGESGSHGTPKRRIGEARKAGKLLGAHASQVSNRNYIELQLTRARLLGARTGVDYAMALYPNDPILFGSLKEAGISARGF